MRFRKAADQPASHDGRVHCTYCGQTVDVDAAGRCDLGHRVTSPEAVQALLVGADEDSEPTRAFEPVTEAEPAARAEPLAAAEPLAETEAQPAAEAEIEPAAEIEPEIHGDPGSRTFDVAARIGVRTSAADDATSESALDDLLDFQGVASRIG